MTSRSKAAGAFAFAALLLAGCASLERTPALPKPCGDQPGTLGFGCANRANLAAMVADPADLERGRDMTPGSGARAAQVLETWRSPPPRDASAEAKTETTR